MRASVQGNCGMQQASHSRLARHQVTRRCAEGPWQGISVSFLASKRMQPYLMCIWQASQSRLAIQAHLACAELGDSLAFQSRLATKIQQHSARKQARLRKAGDRAERLTASAHCWMAACYITAMQAAVRKPSHTSSPPAGSPVAKPTLEGCGPQLSAAWQPLQDEDSTSSPRRSLDQLVASHC